jgi:ribosomal protein L29
MSEAADRDDAIRAELKVAAQKARLIDLDWLKLVDMSKVTLEDDGTVKGADELMAALKEAKPYLFGKHARDMTPQEAAAKLAELRKGPAPEPLDMSKTAREMTPAERAEWLCEHKRRFG